MSDIVRLNVMQAFGGVYMDFDVLLVRSLRPLMCYNTTLGQETNGGLANNLIIAIPNSTFVDLWLKAYDIDYRRDIWAHNSVLVPFQLHKKHADLVHVETKSINYPNWYPEGLSKIFDPIRQGGEFDWKKNYAIHLWNHLSANKVRETPESIRKMNSSYGQIARLIYYGNEDMF